MDRHYHGDSGHSMDESIVPGEYDENDSAIEENGRQYHALSKGKYALPNDDEESDRLDMQHHLMLLTLDGELCLCPKVRGANRVLDMGTGTGIWAIDYAEQHPAAEVIGVDLSPMQPEFTPPNCSFEVDDLEMEWTWTWPFDFIFCRMMLGSFRDLPSIIKTAYQHIQPGGYFEIHEFGYPARSDDGTLRPDSYLMQWCTLSVEAAAKGGRPVFPITEYKQYLLDAGFEDVFETYRKWPQTAGPRDQKYKDLGTWSLADIGGGLEAISLAHFTRTLGWSKEKTLDFCAKVRHELRDTRIHAYWPILIVYGRKPMS